MGWVNYIIIDKWKLAIETNRYVEELEEYQFDTLDEIFNFKYPSEELSSVSPKNMTLKEMATLYRGYGLIENLADIEIDKVFLYWLKKRGIDYEISSEFNFNKEEYKNKGYNIIYQGE